MTDIAVVMDTGQGSTNWRIPGVENMENIENIENMEKMENINQMS